VNRLISTDFDPAQYAHVALYDERRGRIEMHLEAKREQRVNMPGAARTLAAGERIHTENSYKYTPAGFTTMLQKAGFAHVRCWQDPARDFAVFYAA
jgi:uncharacterized SAM-dependent methyltransferase